MVDGPVLTVGAGAAEGPDGCRRTEGSREGRADVCAECPRARREEVRDGLEGAGEAEAAVMECVNYTANDR